MLAEIKVGEVVVLHDNLKSYVKNPAMKMVTLCVNINNLKRKESAAWSQARGGRAGGGAVTILRARHGMRKNFNFLYNLRSFIYPSA